MLKIDEIFLSIQGESCDSGLPTVFIRTFGCDIDCSYCDQPQGSFTEMTENEIIKEVIGNFPNISHICITGGEPLLYKDCLDLAQTLSCIGKSVSIETSGCYPLEKSSNRKFRYVMDIKCPSSLVADKNIFKNLSKLNSRDEVKFVIKDYTDFSFALDVLKRYPTKAQILFSPLFNKENEITIGKDLVDWVLEEGVKCRVQIQLHKILKVR